MDIFGRKKQAVIEEMQFEFCVYRKERPYTKEEAQALLDAILRIVESQNAFMGGGFYQVINDESSMGATWEEAQVEVGENLQNGQGL